MKLNITVFLLLLSASMAFGQKQTEGQVFRSVTALQLPGGGMEKFMTGWAEYLKAADRKFPGNSGKRPRYVHFFVGRDGSLYVPDRAPWASFLETFIGGERRWRLGLSSGRPHFQRVDIELPGKDPANEPLKYHIHSASGKSQEVAPVIYFTSTLPSFSGTSAIVSAVYENGQYQSTVAHQGTEASVQVIKEFLMGIGKTTLSGGRQERSYFYILK